jgi:hypothetical protein
VKCITAWWFWLLIAALLLAGVALGIRTSSVRQWERTKAAFRAQGLGTGFPDLVARAPAVDEDRQERLWAWLERSKRMAWMNRPPTLPPLPMPAKPSRQAQAEAERSAKVFADGRADLADLEALLDEGPVVCSLLGWIRKDFPHPEQTPYEVIAQGRIANLLGCRGAASWWVHAAIVTGDLHALDHLDAWTVAHAQPGCLIDAMVAIAVDEYREDAYWRLALAGRLDDPRLSRWTAETAPHGAWGAAGFDGERMAFHGPLVEHGYGNPKLFFGSHIAMGPCDWLSLHAATASAVRYEAAVSQALRHGGPAPTYAQEGVHGWIAGYGIMAIAIPNLAECIAVYVEKQHLHRQRRQAALLLAAWRRDGVLPATWPTPTDPRLPPLVYERLSDSRFRLGVDPAGPPPSLVPADRIKGSQTGTAAGTKPIIDSRWSLELDCAAGWK